MTKENGFLQLRRGLWEHIRDGRMSHLEALAFIYIASEADTRSGIWKGCAKSLSGELVIPERTARDLLEKMEHGDYIRRFATPGRHFCYPILVHKFQITQGKHNGEQLDAIESRSPADLRYFYREHSVERDGEHGAAQSRSKTVNRNISQENVKATRSSADPRFGTFIGFVKTEFKSAFSHDPVLAPKDFKFLKDLLGRTTVDGAELERRYLTMLHSENKFHASANGSLSHFCAYFDQFAARTLQVAEEKYL